MNSKPDVGAPFPRITLPQVGGGETTLGGAKDRWTMVFIYRGKHCPKCKTYLNKLHAALPAWEAVMDVVVASADTEAKAASDQQEYGWAFNLCYGLPEDAMRAMGLYVSDPLSEAETDARFAEPGAFAIKPDGTLMLADTSNGPAARPDLEALLDGMKFNIENDRPVRGTV
ncbi:MAG: redoxin domain-containing protein [Pseudomonadota bacterium]